MVVNMRTLIEFLIGTLTTTGIAVMTIHIMATVRNMVSMDIIRTIATTMTVLQLLPHQKSLLSHLYLPRYVIFFLPTCP
jgi:hypothetical protein